MLVHAEEEKAVPIKGPVKVYILFGQSNMFGFGKVGPVKTRGTLEHVVKVFDPRARDRSKYYSLVRAPREDAKHDVSFKHQNR